MDRWTSAPDAGLSRADLRGRGGGAFRGTARSRLGLSPALLAGRVGRGLTARGPA